MSRERDINNTLKALWMVGILIVSLVLFSVFASATLPYLNDNQEENGDATSYKAIEVPGELYPRIELYEWKILNLGKKIADIELVENTDRCVTNCYAILKIGLYKNKKDFFNDVIFKNKLGYGEVQYTDEKYDYKIYLKQVTNKKVWRDNKYYNCSNWFAEKEKHLKQGEVMPMPNQEKDCELQSGQIEENITEESWEEYDPTKVLQHGVYYFKITGKKQPYESVDWIPELFNFPIEELAWWNASAPFGDGSDGDLVFTTSTKSYGNLILNQDYQVAGNTLYLYTNRVYQFNNFELGSGTTLTTTNTTGVAMWIEVLNNATISGLVNLSNIHSTGDTGEVWNIYGGSIYYPGVASGGSGGAGGYANCSDGYSGTGGATSSQGLGFGGGGSGGGSCARYSTIGSSSGSGGAGGTGGFSIDSGDYAQVLAPFSSSTGQNGTNSGGGSGAGSLASVNGADYIWTYSGGNSQYGSPGADPIHSPSSSLLGNPMVFARGGGGGNGGNTGKPGFHFYLASNIINFTGVINTSATSGQNGGNGYPNAEALGGGSTLLMAIASGGSGGAGGGAGANAGNISFVYTSISDSGTKIMNKGLGGAGGSATNGATFGTWKAVSSTSGIAGSSGSDGINGTFQSEQIDLSIDITLNTPLQGASLNLNENVTFNCSADAGAKNISNMTLYINSNATYQNLTINQTTYDLVYTMNITEYGTYYWTCDVYNSDGDYNIAPERYFIVRPYTTDTESHANQTYETESQNFSIGISYNSTQYSDISGYLVYDGKAYLSTKQKITDYATFYSTIDIPLTSGVAQNKSFYWQFNFVEAGTGDTINVTSDIYEQLINPIFLNICNGTYTIPAINFTIKDENNGSLINASFGTTFLSYYLSTGTGLVSKNYSYQNLIENQSTYSFCISPADKSYVVGMYAEYGATGYAPRTKYLTNASISNSTNLQDLYLLADDDATKFTITSKQGMNVLTGTYITISKYYVGEGVYKSIGVRLTDDYGNIVEYLELDNQYRFYAVKDGVSLGYVDKTASCSAQPCVIQLQFAEAVVDTFQGFYDTFATNVAYTLDYNATSKIITFSFNDLTGLAQYFKLDVNYVQYNQSGGSICSETLYATAGTIYCNVSGKTGNIKATGYIARSPEKIVDYILITLSEFAETLGQNGLLFSLFMLITLALVGVWNPVVGIVLTITALFLLNLMGMASIGLTTISIILIFGVIIIWKMRN